MLVAAHGNSLRALVKHLDGIADDEIAGLNMPTGVPLVYELDDRLAPLSAVDPAFGVSGKYLDAGGERVDRRGPPPGIGTRGQTIGQP